MPIPNVHSKEIGFEAGLYLQAVAHGEQETVMEVISQRASLWLAALVPDLLMASFGPSLREASLPHLGCSLVRFQHYLLVTFFCVRIRTQSMGAVGGLKC